MNWDKDEIEAVQDYLASNEREIMAKLRAYRGKSIEPENRHEPESWRDYQWKWFFAANGITVKKRVKRLGV